MFGRILSHVWVAMAAVAAVGCFQAWSVVQRSEGSSAPTVEWVVSRTLPGLPAGTTLADHDLRNRYPDLLREPMEEDEEAVPAEHVYGFVVLLSLLFAPVAGVVAGLAETALAPKPGWTTAATRAGLVLAWLVPLALVSTRSTEVLAAVTGVAACAAIVLAAATLPRLLPVRFAQAVVALALVAAAIAPLERVAAARPLGPTLGAVQGYSVRIHHEEAPAAHAPDDDWTDPSPTDLPEPARVVLIAVDTLGANHVSANGYGSRTTPRLEEMAEREGIVFERNTSSAPWTLPSTTSLFTSLHTHQHGVEDDGRRLHEDVPTLAGAFASQGWRSAALVTHLYVSSKFGLDSGFHEFWELAINRAFFAGHQLIAAQLSDRVVPWLRENRDERFFLYVHYFDPHWDYEPPAPYDRMFANPAYRGRADGTWDFMRRYGSRRPMPEADLAHCIALYDGEIAYTDHHLGLVFDEMRRLGIWDDALVVIVADHGEELQEHGSFGHAHTVYEEQVWVPLIVKPPGGRPAAWRSRVAEQTRSVDVAPTLLEIAGLRMPPSFVGESLVPLMRAEGTHRDTFSRTIRNRRTRLAVTHDRWKLIRNGEQSGSEELYDLRSDPGEQANRVADYPEIVADLRARMDAVLDDPAGAGSSPRFRQDVEISDDEREALEALGYVE